MYIVPAAHIAEAVREVGADARARRLLGLNPARVEAGDDLVDTLAHALARNSGPHVALEEAWREAVRYTLKNVRLLKDLAERDVIAVSLGPLGDRVGAENNRVAVVAVGLSNRGLESGKEGVLHVPHHGPPHGPAAAVEVLLVDHALSVDYKATERVDLVSEHLGFCSESKESKWLVA